ncbi:uncharacterized protein [Diadema setosum]|uniref:uncharacterized protein n=1 Tax=Diadema setosum TaxID=31175 RepID=UPI003B3A85B6
MISDNADSDPQPRPPPVQRTSSPNLDCFPDPLLSLTPDKPNQKLTKFGKEEGRKRSGLTENSARTGQGVETRTAGKSLSQGEAKNECRSVIPSNPGVLFKQEKVKHKDNLEQNLQLLKGCEAKIAAKRVDDARKVECKQDKENRSAGKIDRLTRQVLNQRGSNVAKDVPATSSRKSAMVKSSSGPGRRSNGEVGTSSSQKHVRIVDPKCPLSTPELHSTAVLGQKLKELKGQPFDAEEVVLKTLQDSESARTALNERVAETTNVDKKDSKYTGLVGLSVPVDETLETAIMQKLSRVRRQPTKPSTASEVPPPDILDMFSPTMIVEAANLDVTGLMPELVKPEAVDPETTFELYRHMQCWDLEH